MKAKKTDAVTVPRRLDAGPLEAPADTPKHPPFDPEPGRERLRGRIAAALIVLLFLVILLAFAVLLLSPRPMADLKDFLIVIVPPITSLVSAVVGFYYGSTRDRG